MRVREVVPDSGTAVDVTTDEGRAWLAAVYARRDAAYVRLNMITSLTGAAAGSDGTSDTLTSRVDRTILGAIRADADVVVVGAGTVRAEEYILPRRADLAVVTASGDLRGHRIDEEAGRVFLVAPAARADEVRRRSGLRRAEVVPVAGGERLDAAGIVSALRERGLHRIVCEGGPQLAGAFAAAGAIDEYCVTVAPVLEPAEHPFLRLPAGARPATRVAGALVDEAAFSYLRLRARA